MASPIAHIVYAEDFLNSVQYSFSREWRNEFIAGSLFPDIIRLLPYTSRELTHNRYPVDLDLSALRPFYAGWEFWRVTGSAFYRHKEKALESLWKKLDELDIKTITD